MDDESSAIYHWVFAKIQSGGLYDPVNDEFYKITDADILDNDFLKYEYQILVYRNLAIGFAYGYGNDDVESKESRAKKIYHEMIGEKLQGGNQRREDAYALLDLLEEVHGGGVPVEFYHKIEYWQDMKPPKGIKLQPLARLVLSATEVHSNLSAERRLVDKFRKHYPLIVARYLFQEATKTLARRTALSVGKVLADKQIPFRLS